MGEPRILAGFVRSFVNDLSVSHSELVALAFSRMCRENVRALEDSSRVGWLPLAVDVDLTKQLFECAGEREAEELFRRAMVTAFDGGLLRPLLSAGRVVLGSSPDRLLRWAPRVWSMIYRDAGELSAVESHAEGAVLRLAPLVEPLANDPVYLQGLTAMIRGFLEVAAVSGTVHREKTEAPAEARFRLSWRRSE